MKPAYDFDSCRHQLVAALVSRARITPPGGDFRGLASSRRDRPSASFGSAAGPRPMLGWCHFRAVWAPWITSVFALFALFLLVSTLEANVAPVDVWALVVVAPLLVFSTLCISFGTTYRWWTGKALSIDQLQEGFARNRAWERPSRALGQHIVFTACGTGNTVANRVDIGRGHFARQCLGRSDR